MSDILSPLTEHSLRDNGSLAADFGISALFPPPRSTHLGRIAQATEKCENMARAGAYLHHYLRYGMEEDDIWAAVDKVSGYVSAAADCFGLNS